MKNLLEELREKGPDNCSAEEAKVASFFAAAMDEETIESHGEVETKQEIMGLTLEEQSKLLQEALSNLPRTDNLIVSLYYYHGKDLEEISEIVGLTQNNVKVKLFRIRKKLLKEMSVLLDKDINTVA